MAEFAACLAVVGTRPAQRAVTPRSLRIIPVPWRNPRMRGLPDFRSSIKEVLIDSNGVTANTDSTTPAESPARTVLGPEIVPVSGSVRRDLIASKVRKRMPALIELPMIRVVQPAYHSRPKRGQGSFCPVGRRRFSCVRVLANSAG